MSEIWWARERSCGREISVERNPKTGVVSGPAKCPHCGAQPCTWDLIELAGKGASIPNATTAALELARLHGVDLATITGSGRAGAITADDVRKAIAAKQAAQSGEIEDAGGDVGDSEGGGDG